MKITRPGKLPENYMHTGKCTNCHCEVRFERGEGEVVRDPRDGDYVWIKCPTDGCPERITSALSNGR